MHVLIVDDDKFVRQILRIAFENQGIRCTEAADGLEGLQAARQSNPDAIVLDIMLPRLDGYKVSRMLKFDENYSHIPIVMLTSRGRLDDVQTGFMTGADAYITKPFEPDEVVRKVVELVKSKAEKEV